MGVDRRDGWVERSPHHPAVVGSFHRYAMLGRLATGGMAEIFLAREKDAPNRTAVIKRLLPTLLEEDELRAMFVDEARLGMRLAHPNLCRVYDVGELEGHLAIAMEWIDGVTLAELIDRVPGGLPERVALAIVADVADALFAVHHARDEHGQPLDIVHRDVTPRNVMIGFDGRVKLLDFGLAKSVLNEATTRPGTAKGKFAYLAPELWREGAPDLRADLFSLGCCLYEALTGALLYHRDTPFATRDAILGEPVPSLATHAANCDPALDRIVQRCLAKRPSQRYESAGALQKVLLERVEHLGPRVQREEIGELVRTNFAERYARGPTLETTSFGTQISRRTPVFAPIDAPRRTRLRAVALWCGLFGLGLAVSIAFFGWPRSERARIPVASAPPPTPIEVDEPIRSAPTPADPHEALHAIAARLVEAPNVAPTPTHEAPAPARGRLSINTRPWSEVRVDGRRVGVTPIAELPVEAGVRQLTLVDAEGRVHRRSVRVPANGSARVFAALEPR